MLSRSKLAAITLGTALFAAQPAIAHPGHGALLETLVGQPLNPGMMLAGIGIAFAIGAGHAFSPGHGKTMVAAYLVGSRSTPRHAFGLGLIVTVTHTLGVFALGLFALLMSRYILPEQLYPILSLLSGLMVLGVGVRLLQLRLKEASGDRDTHHHHHHHHHPHHAHSPDELAIATTPSSHSASQVQDKITWRSLVALGVAGGIAPCPSALVLLLSAIALQQTAYGMLLISSFSLGLASVLVAIGLMVVYSRHWLDRLPELEFVRRHLPIFSAAAIAWIGFALVVVAIV